MQSQSLLLPAIQTIHKITNARTGYHKQSHEIYPDEGNHYNQLINNKLS